MQKVGKTIVTDLLRNWFRA